MRVNGAWLPGDDGVTRPIGPMEATAKMSMASISWKKSRRDWDFGMGLFVLRLLSEFHPIAE
jgi:hypothetical protein